MRQSHPWYRQSKGTWYATMENGRKVSLGVKGEEYEAEAVAAWHRLIAKGREEQEQRKSPTVSGTIRLFWADAEERMKPNTVKVLPLLSGAVRQTLWDNASN